MAQWFSAFSIFIIDRNFFNIPEDDAVELTMKGGEAKIETALSFFMLNHPKFYKIVKNGVMATEREEYRQTLKRKVERLANLN